MKKYICILFILAIAFQLQSQVENVPADHEVYPFLKRLSVKGVLAQYDDFVLPLSRKQVVDFLIEAKTRKEKLTSAENGFLEKMLVKLDFTLQENEYVNILDDFPDETFSKIFSEKQKYLYHYHDSVINFNINPLADYKFIYSDMYKDNSHLLNYGGYFSGSYNDWFGFYLKGTIGIQSGSRNVAKFDKRAEQSYSFNNSNEKKYFDDTEGYAILNKGIFTLQFGRERVLFGNGYTEKLILSDNPPKFDFIKLNIKYKKLSYDFIHGWLVHPADSVNSDQFKTIVRTKPSKYLAISRLGFNPNSNLSLGVSQIVIYSDRPLELAYLNPFLFWESAQRSLNDPDNSFLSFDIKYLIKDGLEISSSAVFDDINFNIWKKGEWNSKYNRIAIQIGTMLTDPVIFKNTTVKLEYILLRPYIFSHYGLTENSLTYTSNSYFLGIPLEPNSTAISTEVNWLINEKMNLSLFYKHILHGQNEYDSEGNLIKNYGGNVFETFTWYDDKTARLLDGIVETKNIFSFNLNYEFVNGIYLNFLADYFNISSDFNRSDYFNLISSVKVKFN